MTRSNVQLKSVQSKIRPITKTSISEEVAEQIVNLISSGDLKPGQRLPAERDLCKDFGCSRSSLREALRCLSIVGVLNARVGEGTSVATNGAHFLGKVVEWRMMTERHDVDNLLEVRMALEDLSAAKAATLRTDEDVAALAKLIEQMETAVGNRKRFATLDLNFHIALAQAAGNNLLYDLITMIRSQLVRGLSTVLVLPNAMELSHKEHVAIFLAVKRGNEQAARKAMDAHLNAALQRFHKASEAEPVKAHS